MANAGVWRGVYPAVTTKFDDRDLLDHEEMARCFGLQLAAGVDGLIVAGSLGEASTLEASEKLEILKTALGVAGKKPVLLTICDGSTRAAAKLAEAGAKAGAAGLMVLPGLPYKSDSRETMVHLRAVAKAGGLPVMIYNNPLSYGVDITPAMLGELADEPLFAAIKESSGDITRVTDIQRQLGQRYKVFTGVDNLALESLAAGADGWVAGLVVAFPRETVALYKLVRDGQLEKARALYRWFRPLLDLDVSTKLVQNIKTVEALTIGSTDTCRPPRLPLADADLKIVTRIVKQALATRPKLN